MGADGALGYVGAAREYEMLRKTVTILSLIGLLLSVGAWGVSYYALGFSADVLIDERHHEFGLGEGTFFYNLITDNCIPSSSNRILWRSNRFHGFRTRWWGEYQEIIPGHWRVFIPLWMPSGLFAISLMLCCLPLGRRRKRKKLGLCIKCGYDLRGSKDRCPECGNEFETT